MIFVYFDKNGIVKETINNNSTRVGNSNSDRIYCYFEGEMNFDDVRITLKRPDDTLSNEISIANERELRTIPYEKNKDYKYFEDYKKYNFYYYEMTSDDTKSNGLCSATIRAVFEERIYAQGLLTFNIQQNVIKEDHFLTISQYDQFVKEISSITGKVRKEIEEFDEELTKNMNGLNSDLTKKMTNLDEKLNNNMEELDNKVFEEIEGIKEQIKNVEEEVSGIATLANKESDYTKVEGHMLYDSGTEYPHEQWDIYYYELKTNLDEKIIIVTTKINSAARIVLFDENDNVLSQIMGSDISVMVSYEIRVPIGTKKIGVSCYDSVLWEDTPTITTLVENITTERLVNDSVTTEKTNFIKPSFANLLNYKNINIERGKLSFIENGYKVVGNESDSTTIAAYTKGVLVFAGYKANSVYTISFNVKVNSTGYTSVIGVGKETNKKLIELPTEERVKVIVETNENGEIYIYLNSYDLDIINVAILENANLEDVDPQEQNFTFKIGNIFDLKNLQALYTIGKNLIDPTKIVKGFYIANNKGDLYTNENFITTDFIKLEPNTDYVINGANRVLLYDKDLIPIDTSWVGTAFNDDYTFNTGNDGKYIRISYNPKTYPKVQLEKGVKSTTYIPYSKVFTNEINLSEEQVNYLRTYYLMAFNSNTLFNKVISFNGDSICAGAGYSGGYGKIIAENNNMIYENKGVSGGTIATGTSASYYISTSIVKMREDADYIILEGGFNDYALKVELGTLDTTYNTDLNTYDTTNFTGAFEYMIVSALKRYNGKKIGFINIHKVAGHTALENYLDRAIEICRKWSIPYLDLRESLGYSTHLGDTFNIKYFTNANDGSIGKLHPNEDGYRKLYVPKIEAWLKNL